jgi:integrase
MPSKSITDAFVRTVRLPRKDDRPNQVAYFDKLERGLQLVLVVSYGGSKTFRCLTYLNGKPRTRKLGLYPAMSVKQARAQARAYWEDPQKYEAQAESGTFKDIAEQWVKAHVDAKRLRSAGQIKRMLNVYVLPRWGNLPFVSIRRAQVAALLDHIVDHHPGSQGGRAMADAVLAVIRNVCNWYESKRSETYHSPIGRRMRRDKRDAKERSRSRILTDDELRAVWQVTGEAGVFGSILRTCLLTAQRSRKVASMKRTDIKDDDVWDIAQEPREKGNAGLLRLPPAALDIIKAQYKVAGNPFVFAGQEGVFQNWDIAKKRVDRKLREQLPHMQHWTIHDLRRTARSLMSRAGVISEHAERVMGHVIGGVEGVYDRHKYSDEKAEALARLASLIRSIVEPPPANVVKLTAKQRRR